jgi:hypothetical protein
MWTDHENEPADTVLASSTEPLRLRFEHLVSRRESDRFFADRIP